MSLGSAGCVQDACRRLREVGREMGAIGAKRIYARVFDARADPIFEAFPCRHLCMECRFLADPPAADPMRGDVHGTLPACPHCGSTAWIDLSNTDAKEQVDTVDMFDRAERRRNAFRGIGRAFGVVFMLAVLAGVTLSLATGDWDVAVGILALLAFVLPIAAIGLGGLSSGYSVTARRRANAARWRMPAPARPRRRGPDIMGEIRVADELCAPLTGRPCAGYEIGVRRDGRSRAGAASWLLIEQENARLEVAGLKVEPGAAYLDLQRTEVDASEIVLSDEALSSFLRARGLDPTYRYAFFETILPRTGPARLHAATATSPAVLAMA